MEIDQNVFGLGRSNVDSTELKLKRALERSEFKIDADNGEVNQRLFMRDTGMSNHIPDGYELELIERSLLFLGEERVMNQSKLHIDKTGGMFDKVGQGDVVSQRNGEVRLNAVKSPANKVDLPFQNTSASAGSKTDSFHGLFSESGIKLNRAPYGPNNIYIVERAGVKTLFVRDYKNDSIDVEAIRELLREHGVEPDRIIVNGREY